jgi:hypothetical protein
MGWIREFRQRVIKENATIGNLVTALDLNLSWRQRAMRLACRSNILRKLAVRRAVALNSAPPFPTFSGNCVTGPPPNQILGELNEKGFGAGISIADSTLQQILGFCSSAKFISRADYDREISIDVACEENPLSGEHYAYSLVNAHKQCEAIEQLVHDPYVVDIARRYLNREPVLISCRMWWSYPYLSPNGLPLPSANFAYHYDIDDYKFLKLFIYLIDVDMERGPHVIIAGTHKGKTLFEKLYRYLTDEQAVARYGDRIKVMTGVRGTGFFEDTLCYHKGENPKKRRLMLEFEYSFHRYF